MPDRVARYLQTVHRAHVCCTRSVAVQYPLIPRRQALLDYLRGAQGHETVETVRVLYLNSVHRLIHEEVMWAGCVDEVPIYPRPIVIRALEVGASGLIIVHNHPSGDPKASAADISATRDLHNAAKGLGIAVLEHLIVTRADFFSFRDAGFL